MRYNYNIQRQNNWCTAAAYWMNDIAEALKHEDRGQKVRVLEPIERLHTSGHELLPLLVSTRRQFLEHLEEEFLTLVDPLSSLNDQTLEREVASENDTDQLALVVTLDALHL